MSGRRRAAVAALAASATLAVPATSSAALPLLGGKSSSNTNPLGAVFGLLGGQNGLGGVLQSVLCPPLDLVNGTVGGLNDLTGRNPVTGGLHQLTTGLTNLACNASILDYKIQTRFRRANGTEAVRTVTAQLGVPKPLNVDDDAAADLVGTITLTAPNTVGLIIERAPGENGPLPASVEAIVGNPNGRLLSGRQVNVGYDARDDRSPGRFELTTPVDTFFGSKPVYDVRVKQLETGERLTLLAGTFGGTPDARKDVTALRLAYGRSPVSASLRVTTGATTNLRATTDRPGGSLTASVLSDGLDADIELAKFPNNVDLSLNASNGSVTYDGHGASIERLTADVRPRSGGLAGIGRIKAVLDGLPNSGRLSVAQSGSGVKVDADGEIGLVDLRTAPLGAALLDPPNPDGNGVRADVRGDAPQIAARIAKLRSVEFATDPVALKLSTGAAAPFAIDATLDGAGDAPASVVGAIEDLPETFELGLQDDGLRFAGSAPVERLTLDARGLPIADGVDRLRARLDRLPAEGSLAFGGDENGVEVKTTGGGIGRVELQAGPEDALPSAPGDEEENGALVRAAGDDLQLGVRLHDLQEIAVDPDPLALRTKMGSVRPLRIEASLPGEGGAEATVNALIRDLPEEFRLGLEDAGLTYGGSAPVELLELDATNLPIGNGADRLKARLDRLPAEGALSFGGGEDGLSVNAGTEGIGRIEIQAGPSTGDLPVAPGAEEDNGARVDMTGGSLLLGVRLHDLREITVNPSPLALRTRTGSARPLLIDAKLPGEAPEGSEDPATPISVEAEIRNLPEEFDLGLEDLEDGGSKLAYNASAPVDFLKIEGDGIAFTEGASGIGAAITRVPKAFSLSLPATAPGQPLATLEVPDDEQPIGELRLVAGGDLPETGLNEDGTGNPTVKDELKYTDGGIGLRLTGLRSLSLTADPLDLHLRQDPDATKPIDIEASLPNGEGQAPATITGELSKTTASTRIQALISDDAPTKLVFTNASNLGRVALEASNLGELGNLQLSLDNLAPKLSVCVDAGPRCRRPNPNALSGGTGGGDNRPYPALFSVDFDDEGTQQSGQTTFNATLPLEGSNVTVQNVRFRNLGFDLGQGPTFSYLTQQIPRLYLFMDSRGQPFMIDDIRLPGQIEHFRLGTAASNATGTNRIAWLKGTTGFLGASLDRVSAGQLNCGGQREISISVGGLFNANILNFLGTQIVPLCS